MQALYAHWKNRALAFVDVWATGTAARGTQMGPGGMRVRLRPKGLVYHTTRFLAELFVKLRPSTELAFALETKDRRIFEDVILPHVSREAQYQRILFVGVQMYTRHYERDYFSHKDLWTIDLDPRAARYGARRHIIDSITSIGAHFGAGTLDVIICNGILGRSLNEEGEMERATFRACHACLRTAGLFVLGWDESPARPFSAEEHRPLGGFEPCGFPPLSARTAIEPDESYPLRHVFDVYRKL